jgi:hypothetical protein
MHNPSLLTDAQALADQLGTWPPLSKYDSFINYYLVPAFSKHEGTDRCWVDPPNREANTAFGTYWKEHSTAGVKAGGQGLDGCADEYAYNPQNVMDAKMRLPAYASEEAMIIYMVNYDEWPHYTWATASFKNQKAVIAAASEGTIVPPHEMGHMIFGLGDEYGLVWNDCPAPHPIDDAPNVSVNGEVGVWPEWIIDTAGGACTDDDCIGAPLENGHTYTGDCFYHPTNSCLMERSSTDFCVVCSQHRTKMIFGHANIAPIAPLESASMFIYGGDGTPLPPFFLLDDQPPCFSFDVTLSPLVGSPALPVTVEQVMVAPDGTTWVDEGIPDPDWGVCAPEPGHYYWYFSVTAEPDLVKTEYPEFWESSTPSNRDYAVWEFCTGDPHTHWCECFTLPEDTDCQTAAGCTKDPSNCWYEPDLEIPCGEWEAGGTFGCEPGYTVRTRVCDCVGDGGPGGCSIDDREFECLPVCPDVPVQCNSVDCNSPGCFMDLLSTEWEDLHIPCCLDNGTFLECPPGETVWRQTVDCEPHPNGGMCLEPQAISYSCR